MKRYGGPDALQVLDEESPEPKAGEVRVHVLAAGVAMPDVAKRKDSHPDSLQGPRTPEWNLVGEVERLGAGVSGFQPGQIVAAMPIHGAYADYVCLPQSELMPVPAGIDRRAMATLALKAENERLKEALSAILDALHEYAEGPATHRETKVSQIAVAALNGVR